MSTAFFKPFYFKTQVAHPVNVLCELRFLFSQDFIVDLLRSASEEVNVIHRKSSQTDSAEKSEEKPAEE